MVDAPMVKRVWVYVQRPHCYEIAGCLCGNSDPDWSEFEGKLWCPTCQIDFVPTQNGVFDGPIPVATAALLGMCFDRFNIESRQIEKDVIAEAIRHINGEVA
jgi:hypothetical protein